MATKAMSIKMDESKILDIKLLANVFHMTMTDVIIEALDEYIANMKKDPFYRLTVNVQDASEEESEEILNAINELSDDDLLISQTKSFRE